jgi:hypothetical protein
MMRTIGLKCGYLDEAGYHTWPLFIEFRETEEFVSTSLEVYGHPYALKLREEAGQASKRAAEEAKREPSKTAQTLEGSSSDVGNDELNPEMANHQTAWYRERRRVRPALDGHQRRTQAAGAIRRTGTNLTSRWLPLSTSTDYALTSRWVTGQSRTSMQSVLAYYASQYTQ